MIRSYKDYFAGIQDFQKIESIRFFNSTEFFSKISKKSDKKQYAIWLEATEIMDQISNIKELSKKERIKLYKRIRTLRTKFFRYENEPLNGEIMVLVSEENMKDYLSIT